MCVINPHGFIKFIPEWQLPDAEKQGSRRAHPEDWVLFHTTEAEFKCPWIRGVERGSLGSRPVLVIGQGPSREATLNGAYRLQVNPRPASPDCDAIIALDEEVFHDADGSVWNYRWPQRRLFIGPKGGDPTRHGDWHRFGLPVHPVDGRETEQPTVAINGAISELRLTAIAACLVAQYLSTGPVVLTGIDLTTVQDKGRNYDYASEHLGGWKKALKVLSGIYRHKEMQGPLCELLPVWSG